MAKGKEGGYKVPDELKKPCPYCGQLIAKQGLRMHHNFKHPGEEFIPFDEIKGTKQKKKEESSGGESFRGEGSEEGSGEEKENRDAWGDFDEW